MSLSKIAFSRGTLLLMGLGLVVLLALGAALLWQVTETRTFVAQVERSNQNRLSLARILVGLDEVESAKRGYLLTHDRHYLEHYLELYRNTSATLPEAIEALTRRVAAAGGDTAPLAQLRQVTETRLAQIADIIAQAERGELEAALARVRSGEGEPLMLEARNLISRLEAGIDNRLKRRTANLDQSMNRTLLIAGVACLLILAIASGSALLAWRYTAELERAQAGLEQARANLEQRVEERTAELAAANEEVQRFAYIVSHDLRAPLVNVMGFTAELETAIAPLQALMARVEAEAPQLVTAEAKEALLADLPEALGFIRSATRRMDLLISAILKLSREGRRNLVTEEVDLDALLRGIAASLAHQLDAAGAELQIEGRLPTIATDRLAIEQVLGNLVDNAVKYLDPARPGRITVRARIRRGMVTIEVEDNGRGIDPRDHARIFELFRRAGNQDQPGEGIGLAHVRALARRLGGTVTCDSTPGEGARFRVILPVTGPRETEEKPVKESAR